VAVAVSAARSEILSRVHEALRDVPAGEEVAVPREYRTEGELAGEELVALFRERVADYRATVRAAAEAAPALAEACREHGIARLLAAPGVPAEWEPEGTEVDRDDGRDAAELDLVEGVLTGCAVGIAETGTIALDSSAVCGRRALTLVPDRHLCVVEAAQIVETVPEALARLAPAVREGRPITLVSGPSATSDIELNRVEGVHGPRTLEVVVLG
jgi:L-lactate dehydrogenase complex protein LldG